jgi:hypothetical protein
MSITHNDAHRSSKRDLGGHQRNGPSAYRLFTWLTLAAAAVGCSSEEPPTEQREDEVEEDDVRDGGKVRDGGSPRDGSTRGTKPDAAAAGHAGAHDETDAEMATPSQDGGHGDSHDAGANVDKPPAHDGGKAHDMAACKYQGAPDPRDEMIRDTKPVIITAGRSQDTMLPDVVIAWMKEREFAESHDAWHLIRRWDQGCRKSNAPAAGCRSAERFESQGLWRAEIQQGAPGDGYAFMAMHRHMIHMLKESFPKHTALFDGFKKVPRTRNDPENPQPWRNVSWTSNNLKGFDILENIEQNLSMFPTEDDLGRYFQVTFKWSAMRPTNPTNEPGSGLHGALHAQWSVTGSPGNLIDQKVDVYNYIFWKLHGWADDVWERYRKAKGITESDPTFQKVMAEQCQEMLALLPSQRKKGGSADGGMPTGPIDETGVFATEVRPILEEKCAGCHGESGAMAGVTLGGVSLSSADLIQGLVGVDASNGEYKLVVPNEPENSWLYLKATGESNSVMCSSRCDRERMPPSGAGLTMAELNTLRTWIESGAAE